MKLSILGSTGSIGTQTLDVCRKMNYDVTALSANRRVDVMERQIREFSPKIAVMADDASARDLAVRVKDTSTKVLGGDDALLEVAASGDADTVVNSLVGMRGLVPTVAAIVAKKKIALANKETLVAGGDFVMKLAHENGVDILPVDSEHSAIFQCLQGKAPNNALKKIILTASGGPFFGKTRDELKSMTKEDALKHPNWDMGAKITIDSATMMNKGFEVAEALHLFGVTPDMIDVVVHRESIVHSMVEYNDNSVIAQLGVPDMRIPIQYALTYPERYESPVAPLDLTKVGNLSFYQPDYDTFGCLKIMMKAIRIGGLAPCAVNAANEVAVELFLKDKIGFLDIEKIARFALESVERAEYSTLDEVLECDKATRAEVYSRFGN